MNKFNDITLCILNRNDGESLKKLIPETPLSVFAEVFAIDANSTDNSVDIFKMFGVPVFLQQTLGRGSAIVQALNICATKYIIFFSSDGEEDPNTLHLIAENLINGSDLVIASRLHKSNSGFKSDHNRLYIHRKIYLKFITFLINSLFGGNVLDCWNGFRGMEVSKAKLLNFDAKNFLIEAQTTIRFISAGHTITEVPTVERPRLHGSSQNPILSSGFGHLVLIFKEYLKRG